MTIHLATTAGGNIVVLSGGGVYSPDGGSGPVTNFNYYISTTGSNSNAGTLSSPWAITAINAKQTTYAGKRVGILPGTYDVSGLMGTYQAATLNINGGTSSVPTYIGTSDSSGNYQQGTATLDAKGSSGFYGGSTTNISYVIGTTQGGGTSGPTPPNWGNWTLDGLNITGFSLWAVVVGSYDSGGGQVPNVIIQNCTLHDGNGAGPPSPSGRHISPMELYCFNNLLISNCWFYNYSAVGADSTHCEAMTVWGGGGGGGATGLIVTGCTFVNAGGIYGIEDTGTLQNVIIEQCYFDMTTGSSAAIPNGLAIEGFGIAAATLGSVFRNNIIVGGGGIDLLGAASAWGATAAVYNNTWDLAGGAGWTSGLVGFRFLEASGYTGIFSCYNNLCYDNGSTSLGSYGYNFCNTDGFAVCDYNIYGTQNKFDTYGTNGNNTQTGQTFTSWKTATGKDAHSTTSATNPFTNTGILAAQYKVQSGSTAYQTGKVGGTSGGATINVGAWDGIVTQIGCTFSTGPGFQYKFNPGDYMQSVNVNGTGSSNQAEMNLLATGAATAVGVSGYMANYTWGVLESNGQGVYASTFANIASDYNYLQSKNPGLRFGIGILADYNNVTPNSTLPSRVWNNQIVPDYILNCGGTLNVYNTVTYPTSSGATTSYTLAAQVTGQYGYGMSDYDGSSQYYVAAAALWDPGVNAAWINFWKALSQFTLQWTTASGGDNNYYTLDNHPLIEFMRNGNEVSYNFNQGPYTPAYTSTANKCTVTNYWTNYLAWANAATTTFPHTLVGASVTYGVTGSDGSTDSASAFNTSTGWLSPSKLSGITGLVLCTSDTFGSSWSAAYNNNVHAQAANSIQAFIGIATATAEANITLPTPTDPSLQGIMPIFSQVQDPDYNTRMHSTSTNVGSYYYNTSGGVLQIMNAANGTTAPSSAQYTMGASHAWWCSSSQADYNLADWHAYIQSTFSINRGTYPLNTTRPTNLP
jgi:hypothetical protein